MKGTELPQDAELLDWLFARQRFGVQPGLSRVQALLGELGDPQESLRVVLVGGTNGKGSTSAVLAGMLSASGERTGLFTSPHLTRFTERFVVDGQELPAPVVVAALARIRPLAEALDATFFEVVTALAVLLFARAGVGTAVMEVGLGGRFDATNALDPALSVVTNVALDHMEVLGDRVELIAHEKAGILRRGRAAVTGAEPPALEVLREAGADLWSLGHEAHFDAESLGWEGWQVQLRSPAGQLDFRTPLLGGHGARNAALAALAALRLGVPEGAVRTGAATTAWPGRMERLTWRDRQVLLDGAHNPDGARALARTLSDLGVAPLPLVFGGAREKDLASVARELDGVASEVILTRAVLSPRAADPQDLASLWSVPVHVAASPVEALGALLRRVPPGGRAVVAGSLYLLGEVRPLLLGEAGEERERWQ